MCEATGSELQQLPPPSVSRQALADVPLVLAICSVRCPSGKLSLMTPTLKYVFTGPGWTLDTTGSQDKSGTYGEAYNHTLHAATSNDSIAFSFEGTSIKVFGTVNLAPSYGGYGEVARPDFHPPWECFVDDISIGAFKPSPFHENNWLLCNGDRLNDGPHEFTFKIQNMTTGTPFWIDYFQYMPSKAPTDGAVFLVENTDPAILYDASWQAVGGVANMTSTHGAQVRFNFTATQLTWMGYIPIELPGNGSSASYSIDDGSPASFFLIGHPPFDGTSIFNQVFFTTPELSNGPHTITVTYDGNANFTPLTLDYIYLKVPSGASSAGPAIVSNVPQSKQRAHRNLVGAIVGGVLGGVAAIAISVYLVLFFRRRKSAKWRFGPLSRLGLGIRPQDGGRPVPFSPMHQPPSASAVSSPLPGQSGADMRGVGPMSGSGFVSGATAQVGDVKQTGAPASVPHRTYVPLAPNPEGVGPSRSETETETSFAEGPPRYSVTYVG